MLTIRHKGKLTTPNAMGRNSDKPKTVKSANQNTKRQEMQDIKYDHVFLVIGKITDKKNNQEI